MPDWAVAIIGPICLLLGIAISEFRQWRQERNKYKFVTFEKRLTVHQEAYNLASEIGWMFFEQLTGQGMPTSDDLTSKSSKMRTWWRGNCLWLDKASRKAFLDLVNHAEVYAESYDPDDAAKCLEFAKIATKKIAGGIGEQHLPDIKPIGKSKK